jgi:hypothetical protein
LARRLVVGLRRVIKGDRCIYCGEAATCRDHFPPYTVEPVKGWLLPSCTECNLLAGDRHPYSFKKRATYVRDMLAHRYKRLLETPIIGLRIGAIRRVASFNADRAERSNPSGEMAHRVAESIRTLCSRVAAILGATATRARIARLDYAHCNRKSKAKGGEQVQGDQAEAVGALQGRILYQDQDLMKQGGCRRAHKGSP